MANQKDQNEPYAILAVRTDRMTGDRTAVAVLWRTPEGDILRNLYNKFSRYDVTTYLAPWSDCLAMLRGEAPLPAPTEKPEE